MKGYTTPEDVARYLGRDFGDNEDAIADLAIGAAEEFIDKRTSVAFKVVGPKTVSVWNLTGELVRLNENAPVSDVVVTAYSRFNSAGYQLYPNLNYEVRNGNAPAVWIPTYRYIYRLDITYTPSPIVPDRIKLAANILVSHYMRPILNDEVAGISNMSVGGELSIAFSSYVQTMGYPAEVDALLGTPGLYIA